VFADRISAAIDQALQVLRFLAGGRNRPLGIRSMVYRRCRPSALRR
jgi:hypothetical protein